MAAEYEVFVDVDDEEDLTELNINGDISAETYETLIELMRRGLDLNEATREELFTLPNLSYEEVDAILRYRADVGVIRDPAALVRAGVVDRRKLAAIAAFLIIREPGVPAIATSGRARYRIAWSQEDNVVPPMALDAEVETARYLSFGFNAMVQRRRPWDVRWDPARQALSATPEAARVRLPKVFAMWDTPKWGVVAGTYMIGFGQRLTFDNTRKYTPNGFSRDNTIYPRPNNLTQRCRRSQGELAPDEESCDPEDEGVYITPDFRWRDTLQGVAIGAKHLSLPVGWLQTYGWFSYQNRDLYQYYLSDTSVCSDPRIDSSEYPQCGSPTVYERADGEPLRPSPAYSYQTLPNMFRQLTAGGNFGYFFDRRTYVGVTGYGSDVHWNVEGAPLGFQDHYQVPFGGPFGAVGVNAAWGRKWSDLGVELTRSFDSIPAQYTDPGGVVAEDAGGGGFAGLARHTATWDSTGAARDPAGEPRVHAHELETIVRYYQRGFANPYARPLASGDDQVDGQRARDEFGGRLRYTGVLNNRARVQTWVNVWSTADLRFPRLDAYLRGSYEVTRWFEPAGWIKYRNKDLLVNGPGQCYGAYTTTSGELVQDPGDELSGSDNVELIGQDDEARCHGQQITISGQARFIPHRRVTITPRYQHRFIDDTTFNDRLNTDKNVLDTPAEITGRMRQDIQVWLTLAYTPIDDLRLRARLRYLNEAYQVPDEREDQERQGDGSYAGTGELVSNDYLEHSIWTYLDASYLIKKTVLVKLRYDLYAWIDKRDSTALRSPNPENRLLLQLEGRF
ncbi:MAG: hypothetical protein H6713_13090 [Myxococcales bacterium]|nr:hypothetical protein [Myxococcales bacterium]